MIRSSSNSCPSNITVCGIIQSILPRKWHRKGTEAFPLRHSVVVSCYKRFEVGQKILFDGNKKSLWAQVCNTLSSKKKCLQYPLKTKHYLLALQTNLSWVDWSHLLIYSVLTSHHRISNTTIWTKYGEVQRWGVQLIRNLSMEKNVEL